MGHNDLSDYDILNIIENARKSSELGISYKNNVQINNSLKANLTNIFTSYNNNSNPYHFNIGKISIKETLAEHNYNRSILSTGMIFTGMPILKKRFVTKGTVAGTSIASKYLSKAFPYKMPFKIYTINVNFKLVSTKVLGRGLGRSIPYVGLVLIATDAIELLIEIYEIDKKNNKVTFQGFGGGGASGYW
ncbi:hypothetical protein ETU10_01320 [Apibacter muscae]|uniref:hypothetical protein n=1 Tax=Apibacter muscae TaxID=2509004 RepID=UPI0011ADD075|nr:hypothetical protein [Apibacter muscae]TWP24629.1 hypothetical protein ETU10_01320 [Apibacter muscae]